ncbi:hypothetical protein Goshw_021484 [Gossypium schwendimanii]|uniref:Uncharacterized protein n=1 Tax=Gossypium schwendimanii TaxID=34291 RepID=A0A7J9MUM7_GOSSC|nr:hypothetical protein [Gossypium schwendimanii]
MNWNQKRKERIDFSVSLKHKEKSKARRGVCRSTDEKLDGMIRWMQEIGLVLQEFSQLNGLRAPNYLPDMFGQMQAHHGDEDEASSENESEQNLPRKEDNYEEPHMEEARQLELSTRNGVITHQ